MPLFLLCVDHILLSDVASDTDVVGLRLLEQGILSIMAEHHLFVLSIRSCERLGAVSALWKKR